MKDTRREKGTAVSVCAVIKYHTAGVFRGIELFKILHAPPNFVLFKID